MTTAKARSAALDAESRLEWGLAADYWQRAIDAYPAGSGALRQRDLEHMESRRASCYASALTDSRA